MPHRFRFALDPLLERRRRDEAACAQALGALRGREAEALRIAAELAARRAAAAAQFARCVVERAPERVRVLPHHLALLSGAHAEAHALAAELHAQTVPAAEALQHAARERAIVALVRERRLQAVLRAARCAEERERNEAEVGRMARRERWAGVEARSRCR